MFVKFWVFKLHPFWQIVRLGMQWVAERMLQLFTCSEEGIGNSWKGAPHPTLILTLSESLPLHKSPMNVWPCYTCQRPFGLEWVTEMNVMLLFHGRGHRGQERLSDLPEATPHFSPVVGLIFQISRSVSGRTFTSTKYQFWVVVHSPTDNMI